jgi:hypothetical protein
LLFKIFQGIEEKSSHNTWNSGKKKKAYLTESIIKFKSNSHSLYEEAKIQILTAKLAP